MNIDLHATCPSCHYGSVDGAQTHAAWCDTFDAVMQLTRAVSSSAAFEDAECKAYLDLLQALPPHALVVEVGLQYGRSSSIALQVAQARNLRYHGIDPFTQPPEAEDKWLEMARSIGGVFQLSKMQSNQVIIGEPIDLVLIDGDHAYSAVTDDCNHFLPRVRRGGHAAFHDFGRDSLPDVYNAVRDYMDGNQQWIAEPVVETLGIWRRV